MSDFVPIIASVEVVATILHKQYPKFTIEEIMEILLEENLDNA